MIPSRLSSCILTLAAAALASALVPHAHAEPDPADKIAAEQHLTTGSWKITFQKGWSIDRVFAKDGTFWSPGRPDLGGRWTVFGNVIVQTYNTGDKRTDSLPFQMNVPTITGTGREGGPMTAVHNRETPATPPVAVLTEQQKAATEALLISGRWRVTNLDWDMPHFCHFEKEGMWHAERRPSQHGNWTLDANMVTLAFPDGHKSFLLLPLDAKNTVYTDENGAPGLAALMIDAASPTGTASAPVAAQATPLPASATPRDQLLSGTWKLSTKTQNIVRTFAKDGTFQTLNDPAAKGQWMITNDFIIMLLPGGSRDVIYLPLNPKGSSGLAATGEVLTAALVTPAGANETPAALAVPLPQPAPQDKDTATALLISAPWIIATAGDAASSRTRTFAKDGTFSTAGHEDEYGWWKIVNNIVIITFADEHKESLKLPLDAQGTSGLGKNGAPLSATIHAKP